MTPRRQESLEAEDLLEVLHAFWEPHDFSKDLGLQAWVVLSYVAIGLPAGPISINELARLLHMRWSKTREILLALSDAGFITMTQAKQGLVLRIKEPKWIPEGDRSLNP